MIPALAGVTQVDCPGCFRTVWAPAQQVSPRFLSTFPAPWPGAPVTRYYTRGGGRGGVEENGTNK